MLHHGVRLPQQAFAGAGQPQLLGPAVSRVAVAPTNLLRSSVWSTLDIIIRSVWA